MAKELRPIIKAMKEKGYVAGAKVLSTVVSALLGEQLIPRSIEAEGPLDLSYANLLNYFTGAKEGPFVVPEKLESLVGHISVPEAYLEYSKILAKDVSLHHDEALAHLLLPYFTWNSLIRSEINTISELKHALATGYIDYIPGIGQKRRQYIHDQLREFEILLKQTKPKT